MAPARHHEKLGQLSMGIVESGRMLIGEIACRSCTGEASRVCNSKATRDLEDSEGTNKSCHEDIWSHSQLQHWADQIRQG